mgnify:CR=1 FL=1
MLNWELTLSLLKQDLNNVEVTAKLPDNVTFKRAYMAIPTNTEPEEIERYTTFLKILSTISVPDIENIISKPDLKQIEEKVRKQAYKIIDYKEQQSKPINYLDTIEFDIDYRVRMIQQITIKNDDQWVWYEARRIPSYRLLKFWPYKI